MATYQLWPPTTVNRIIQSTIYRLANHPLLQNPPIWDNQGNPIKITKWRNYDGLELINVQDLTCSVFPYHYTSSDQSTVPTVFTENSGLVFKPYTLGGGQGKPGDQTAIDEANCTVVIKLHAFGFSQDESVDNAISPGQQTIFQINFVEFLLRQYAELVAACLRSIEVQRLPNLQTGHNLLASSFVHHIDYPTARWDKDANLLLHSASIIWHTKYYVVRNWQRPDVWVPVDLSDGNLLVGTIPAAAVGRTGADVGVVHDTIQKKYFWIELIDPVPPQTESTKNLIELDETLLLNPLTNSLYKTLDANLIELIRTAPDGVFDFSLYFRRIGSTPNNC
jgi:hypothetical protein